jgi:hypothetical protein
MHWIKSGLSRPLLSTFQYSAVSQLLPGGSFPSQFSDFPRKVVK